ncbi:MAG: carboxypeptidase-like regulatory domain-containing protein, partial [Firmicutes bacterium]|nr:carboxypeptidase-like regulatory domain-containing protein [Bacillota bacterium]
MNGYRMLRRASRSRAVRGGWRVAALCVLLLGGVLPAGAQTATTGLVQGTVTDAQGAVILGAEVKLQDLATNQLRTLTTNEQGLYVFANVPPGSYTLTVSAQGFRTATVPRLTVEVNKSYTVNLTLEVGPLTETVRVEASVGVELQTTDAQVGNVLDQVFIRNLPTLQRNTTELLSLQPTATPGGFGTGGTVSGARSDQNTLILDGIDISDNLTGGQGINFTQTPVGVDAVSEFRVTVANPNANFGRSAGGQITLVSPRGSNELHG